MGPISSLGGLRIDKSYLLEALVDPAVMCCIIKRTFSFRCLTREKLDSIPILELMKARPGFLVQMESNKEIKCEGTKRVESKVRIADSSQILFFAAFVRLVVV